METILAGSVDILLVKLVLVRSADGKCSLVLVGKVITLENMRTIGKSAESEGDVLVEELEVHESVAELDVVETCMETLNPVKHKSTGCTVTTDRIEISCVTHVRIERHEIPRSVVAKETLVCKTVSEHELVGSERYILSESSRNLV